LSKGLFFVVSAPAGAGKNTLVERLKAEFPHISESVSYTTRQMRPGEEDGREYHFISRKEFERKRDLGDFLEYANVFGEFYGTGRQDIEAATKLGKHVFLVIDTQGAMQLKGKLPAIFIFITAPSMAELRCRLRKRNTESIEEIEERLSQAEREMAAAGQYKYVICNDDLNKAYAELRNILIAEEESKGKS